MLPKAIYRLNAIPVKTPMVFFTDIEGTLLLFEWNHQRPQMAKARLRKEDKAGGTTLPDFKPCSRAIIIKTACPGIKAGPQRDGTK